VNFVKPVFQKLFISMEDGQLVWEEKENDTIVLGGAIPTGNNSLSSFLRKYPFMRNGDEMDILSICFGDRFIQHDYGMDRRMWDGVSHGMVFSHDKEELGY
jgi:anthranilate/para-aminobenzoate synthase component II